jgi:hypothetical protein
MKHLKFLFVLTLLASVAFVGCKKDPVADDPIPVVKENQFTHDGSKYALSKMYLMNYGTSNSKGSSYNFDLLATSSGLTYDETTDEFGGQGDAIYFEMFSSDSTGIASGTYISDTTHTDNALTFSYGECYINFNISNETGDIYELASGNIVVVRTGTTYEFTLNGTTVNNKALTAYMKATPLVLDYSDMKSKNWKK